MYKFCCKVILSLASENMTTDVKPKTVHISHKCRLITETASFHSFGEILDVVKLHA